MALAGDHIQVLVGGYELTGDSNRLVISENRAMHDVTGFGDEVHWFIPGQRTAAVEHLGFLNADAARSHPVLKSANFSGTVSILVGSNATPAVNDLVYSLDALQGRYGSMPEAGKYVPFGALFANRAGSGGWGVVLAPPTTITNTTNGTTVDNGSATSNGGSAFLHVLQEVASDTYTIIVQGATDSGFTTGVTTLATFTLDGSALGSECITISGSIPQYVRYQATRTGSAGNDLTLAVTVVRF